MAFDSNIVGSRLPLVAIAKLGSLVVAALEVLHGTDYRVTELIDIHVHIVNFVMTQP